MNLRPVALGVAGLLVALAAGAPITLARFTATTASTASLATARLLPPTSLAATAGTGAALAWTPSTSTAASGYLVLRSSTSGSGYTQVKALTPVSAAATTDNPGPGTWYYVLDTYAGAWTSAHSNEASVTVGSPSSTGLKGCTTQTPETSNAGHNDGYEGDPGNGCAKDGSPAVDANSGTNTSLNCADPGKDRARFSGYSFGLPASVTSVDGITVQMVMGLNNNSGTNQVCVQLSWDGGTSWTAARTVSITNTPFQTYTIGGGLDTWGHAWTSAQLAGTAFRVRLTDMSSVTSKDFRLDYLGVGVNYTP